MSRVRIELPEKFSFKTNIAIRITDLNYGGHVGNDTILTLIHEARVRFLKDLQYTELEMEGVGLIMSDAMIEFRAEVFYGDELTVEVTAAEIGRAGFDLYYRMTSRDKGKIVAIAKTGMVCYDYGRKKVTGLPEPARKKLVL